MHIGLALSKFRLGARFGVSSDRATGSLVSLFDRLGLSGARLRQAYGAAGSRPTKSAAKPRNRQPLTANPFEPNLRPIDLGSTFDEELF
jgi:hypothetical protein